MAEAEQQVSESSSSTLGTPGLPPSTGSSDLESNYESEPGAGCPKSETRECSYSRKKRRSRSNTLGEKRSMNKERKKRRRKSKKKMNKSARDTILYKQMANDYWDRWKWEQQRRKESQLETIVGQSHHAVNPSALHHINPAYITDLKVEGKPVETHLGSGSFSIVKLQVYRGIRVAVKQFRSGSFKEDVLNEARTLSSLCHPNLPFLFSVCTSVKPYLLVMQFHGVGNETITISREISRHNKIINGKEWLTLCCQLFDAIDYLHRSVGIIHNDIKGDNVLLSDTIMCSYPLTCKFQVILIDYGKATRAGSGRIYRSVPAEEIQKDLNRYAHWAPEVIRGETRQTTKSDIYSVGVLLTKLIDRNCFVNLLSPEQEGICSLCEKCKSVRSDQRPPAGECLKVVKEIQAVSEPKFS